MKRALPRGCSTFVPQDDPRYPERFVPRRPALGSARFEELDDPRALLDPSRRAAPGTLEGE